MKTLYIVLFLLTLSASAKSKDVYSIVVCGGNSVGAEQCPIDPNNRADVGLHFDKVHCLGRAQMLKGMGIKSAECVKCLNFKSDDFLCSEWVKVGG